MAQQRIDSLHTGYGVLVILTAILAIGCLRESPPEVGESRQVQLGPTRGYVLIALDALRADHLGAYGYERPTSPFFDRLADRAVLGGSVFAPYPSTLVSNLSLFTGLYPPQHGVYPPSGILAADIETLPERFARLGFRTAGHTEGGFMAGGFGFARGFEEFNDTPPSGETDIERTFERGVEFLERLDPGDLFFLFLHTYSTHDPYDPPEPYRSLFADGEPEPGPQPTGATLRGYNSGQIELSARTIEAFKDLYDGSIRYTDHVLEGFFGELERLGLTAESTVVITADHGEEFAEHGKLGHTQIYPESLRIPLLIVHPQLEQGVRVRGPVSSVDVAPTLYDLADIPAPEGLSGRSLLTRINDPSSEPVEVYAEVRDRETGRTILRGDAETLVQLLLYASNPDPGGTWISRSVAFDAAPPRLELEIRSFLRPRVVRLSIDGEPDREFEVDTEWQNIDMPLPPGPAFHRLTLASETCDTPSALGRSDDSRCLSVQVRQPPLHRLELYDLSADPLAGQDLSRSQPALLRPLMALLGAFQWSPVAPPGSQELSPETKEALRALGYLD